MYPDFDSRFLHSHMNDAYYHLLSASPISPISGISAVILAGGEGRRLAPLTTTIPKPLLPVLNLPVLLWTMAELGRIGLETVCANICHLPNAFQEVESLCNRRGPRLRLVLEARPTGPLGGLISCRSALPEGNICLIISGDAIYDVDLHALIEAHRSSGSALTLTTKFVQGAQRYGVVEVDSNGYIISMREKPQAVRPCELVSCGLYVMSRQLLSTLSPRPNFAPYDFIDLVSHLLASGHRVLSHEIKNWYDVGTQEDLLRVNMHYLATQDLSVIASRRNRFLRGELWMDASSLQPQHITVGGRVLLGKDTVIGSGVNLDNVVVGDKATILSNAAVSSSIIMPSATVPSDARVNAEVVGPP
jgi:NDP-sugar pyrophosphorylase family protein